MNTPQVKLRVARATSKMAEVTDFYVEGLGFSKLAEFADHAGFDGVILGTPHGPYHLEFTQEREAGPQALPHAESLLVFYLRDEAGWRETVSRLRALGREPVASHNPYWDISGLTFEDPDGFRVVLQKGGWSL